ncbi:cytochrome c oxidase assembly protein [Amycolatopsis sp.]|uniref:cytochrome c oxidase assembly protein n=1 Tax=Amycolatopsis sp. TaxID=37632 RepID=UPI002C3FB4E1|nr:cytochrome c oxidase assembly protein [Amycolatopsis sp.]HVV08005.1 cytochrome c oxidase assembly protein [Amycolatopsis sp.]
MDVRPALTWQTLVTEWDVPVTVAVLLLPAAVLYLVGLLRTGNRPRGATVSFYLGLIVCAIATGGSVNAYSTTLFTVHMAQHLLLIMVVPALLILGRPLELLRAASGRLRPALGRMARGRIVAVLTHPVFAFVYYAAVVAGTHLTPFQQSAATNPWPHGVEELLYLTSGYLFLLPILAAEPAGRRLAPLLRLVVLLAGMVVDTLVGVTLLMTPRPPFAAYVVPGRGWGPDALTDLHWGGAMMWVGGDLLMAVLAIIVITAWVSSSAGDGDLGSWLESARRSALTGNAGALDASVNLDEDEEALHAYNAMLARMANPRDRRRP